MSNDEIERKGAGKPFKMEGWIKQLTVVLAEIVMSFYQMCYFFC
jgi:hypothetical protein